MICFFASDVEGIAVDWTAGQVYWTDKGFGHIMTSRLDGRHHAILMEDLPTPKGLTVDPVHGLVNNY